VQELGGPGGARLGLQGVAAEHEDRHAAVGAMKRGDHVQGRLGRLAQQSPPTGRRSGAGQLDGPAEVRRPRHLAPLAFEPVRQRLEAMQIGIDNEEARRLGNGKAGGSVRTVYGGMWETLQIPRHKVTRQALCGSLH
jgi:hypothetical protein